MHSSVAPAAASRAPLFKYAAIGLLAGALSGLFGVGGGTIIVPLLLLWAKADHKLAIGTSVAAIFPSAVVGTISYAVQGHINWVVSLCLAAGIVVGAQLGAWLLARLPHRTLQLFFMVFLVWIIVSLWFVIPDRAAHFGLNGWILAALVAVGFGTGILSGILGIGGGVVVVPALTIFFGMSDLLAKGCSLAMMIPGSLSGAFGNAVRRNVDWVAAACIGFAACLAAPLGSVLAGAVSPFVGNILFSLYLLYVLFEMIRKRRRADLNRSRQRRS